MEVNKLFYTYYQNNSGGSFEIDEQNGICEVIIIEAESSENANKRALEIGLYFEGVLSHIDCPCCGDRLDVANSGDGTDKPTVYGEYIEEVESGIFKKRCFIHYINGDIEEIKFKESKKNKV